MSSAANRQELIDVLVKAHDLDEEVRDHGLGAVEVNYGERWFHEFVGEVVQALGIAMTPEERQIAHRRLW